VRKGLKWHLVSRVEEVLELVLLPAKKQEAKDDALLNAGRSRPTESRAH
jgi:hypothetical protein